MYPDNKHFKGCIQQTIYEFFSEYPDIDVGRTVDDIANYLMKILTIKGNFDDNI